MSPQVLYPRKLASAFTHEVPANSSQRCLLGVGEGVRVVLAKRWAMTAAVAVAGAWDCIGGVGGVGRDLGCGGRGEDIGYALLSTSIAYAYEREMVAKVWEVHRRGGGLGEGGRWWE